MNERVGSKGTALEVQAQVKLRLELHLRLTLRGPGVCCNSIAAIGRDLLHHPELVIELRVAVVLH